jgi:hypothetical protein
VLKPVAKECFDNEVVGEAYRGGRHIFELILGLTELVLVCEALALGLLMAL